MADSLEELAPATQSSLAHGKRQELVTVILPEMLRRELAHKGHPTLSQWPGVSWLGSNFSETGGKGHPLCRSIDSKSCIFPSPSLQHRTKIRTALGDNSAPRFLETVPFAHHRFIGPVRVIDARYPQSDFESGAMRAVSPEEAGGWSERWAS